MANKYVDDTGGATDDQSEAQAFITQMKRITQDPTFTVPTTNPNNDNMNAGFGSTGFGNLPEQSKAKKL